MIPLQDWVRPAVPVAPRISQHHNSKAIIAWQHKIHARLQACTHVAEYFSSKQNRFINPVLIFVLISGPLVQQTPNKRTRGVLHTRCDRPRHWQVSAGAAEEHPLHAGCDAKG